MIGIRESPLTVKSKHLELGFSRFLVMSYIGFIASSYCGIPAIFLNNLRLPFCPSKFISIAFLIVFSR